MRKILRALCCFMLAVFAYDIAGDAVARHELTRTEKTACHACVCTTHMAVTQSTEVVIVPAIVEYHISAPIRVVAEIFAAPQIRPPRRLA